MKNKHEETVKVREGAYGPLVWNLSVPESQKSGAVLLGRMLALYDHVMDKLSMLAVYADPDNRGVALARIGRWYEDQSKRVRDAYSRICVDCKGMGRNEILAENFDMDLFYEWYTLESNALASNDLIKKVLRKVWGGNIQDMIQQLAIPGHVFQAWNSWNHRMGQDVTTCLQAAFIPMMQTDDGYRLMAGADWDNREVPEMYEDYANVREDFVKAWRAKEDELLALPPERRYEVWEN